MPVEIHHMRDMLFPGLLAIPMKWERYSQAFESNLFVPETPHIWIPKLTLPQMALIAAGTAIVKNPVVTRRFWQGWFS